ncbi:hypothetical protein B0T20DRAFT_324194, partial [Sordaria brevicollis]
IVKVVERPELSLKYANLDDGLWYAMKEGGTLREMTTPKFKDFVNWRIAQLLEDDESLVVSEPVAERETERGPSSHEVLNNEFANLDIDEDREEGDHESIVDAVNDEDLECFPMD